MVSYTARRWGQNLFSRPTRNIFVIANTCNKVTTSFTYISCRTLSTFMPMYSDSHQTRMSATLDFHEAANFETIKEKRITF